jgi:hypothetical protein
MWRLIFGLSLAAWHRGDLCTPLIFTFVNYPTSPPSTSFLCFQEVSAAVMAYNRGRWPAPDDGLDDALQINPQFAMHSSNSTSNRPYPEPELDPELQLQTKSGSSGAPSKIDMLEAEIEELEADLQREKENAEALRGQLEIKTGEIEELEADLEREQEGSEALRADLKVKTEELAEKEKDLEEVEGQLFQNREQIRQMKESLESASVSHKAREQDLSNQLSQAVLQTQVSISAQITAQAEVQDKGKTVYTGK